MAKKTIEKPYALRVNVAQSVKKTITKVQGKLMMDGKDHNIENAVEHICAEFDKNNQ